MKRYRTTKMFYEIINGRLFLVGDKISSEGDTNPFAKYLLANGFIEEIKEDETEKKIEKIETAVPNNFELVNKVNEIIDYINKEK